MTLEPVIVERTARPSSGLVAGMVPQGPYGGELIADFEGCALGVLESREALTHWIVGLVDTIKMTAYGEPIIKHFGHDDPVTAGYTIIQLIETSSITAHLSPHLRRAHVNIFSCRPFNAEDALTYCEAQFGAHRTLWLTVSR